MDYTVDFRIFWTIERESVSKAQKWEAGEMDLSSALPVSSGSVHSFDMSLWLKFLFLDGTGQTESLLSPGSFHVPFAKFQVVCIVSECFEAVHLTQMNQDAWHY